MLQIVAGPVVGELGLGLAGGRAGQRWGTLAGGWALVGTQHSLQSVLGHWGIPTSYLALSGTT